jgi:hypothetical protein
MDVVPGTEWLSALFVVVVIGVVVVLAVPELRARRWLRWTVVGAFLAYLVGSLVWTYAL